MLRRASRIMIVVVLLSILATVCGEKRHYIRSNLDYIPIPLGRRMPIYQEVSYIEPRLYAPVLYKASAKQRSDESSASPSLGDATDKEHLNTSPDNEQSNVITEKDIDAVPILTYTSDMPGNGAYSYRYQTSDGVSREESAVIDVDSDSEDGSTSRTVRGSYSYPSPDGRTITVEYIADRNGFRTIGGHSKMRKPYVLVR